MKYFDFDHLYRVKESYVSHLSFAIKLGSILFVLSFASLFHGVFPFWFSSTVGVKLEHLVDVMSDRL